MTKGALRYHLVHTGQHSDAKVLGISSSGLRFSILMPI